MIETVRHCVEVKFEIILFENVLEFLVLLQYCDLGVFGHPPFFKVDFHENSS